MKTNNYNGTEYAEFNEMVRRFLRGYTPENEGQTSFAEIKLVSLVLGLEGQDNNTLQLIRNGVVFYYRQARKDNPSKDQELWNGMLSVTAVIDNVIYSK